MIETLLTTISIFITLAFFGIGITLVYFVVRPQPPFAPGTEPKHYWDMTREELEEQKQRASSVADGVREKSLDQSRRRDEVS